MSSVRVPFGCIEYGITCPQCRHLQRIFVRCLDERPYVICHACGEGSASEVWGMLYWNYNPNKSKSARSAP